MSTRPDSSLRLATIWSYSLALGKQAITAAISFVLAAMLGPEAFGVIAMALVFIYFVQMLQQQGLMPAIIARRELTDLHKDTAFWMVFAAGAVFTAAGLIVAPLWADLNNLPELTPVIQVLALAVPLSSSVVVHEAVLRRQLEFKRLAIRSWSAVLAGGIAGIVGAVVGWGMWALVAQHLAMTVVDVLVLWGVSTWRPRARWDRDAAQDLWGYSARSASSSLGLFIGGRMDIILGGAMFGPVAIGVYRMGQRVTELALDISARGMQSVSLPALAEIQHEPQLFAERFRRMLRQATSLSIPLLGVLAGLSACVERFLGREWTGIATTIVLLAVMQAIRSVTLMLGPALQAAGRPGLLSMLLWLFLGLNVIALVIAARGFDTGNELLRLCTAMLIATCLGTALMVLFSTRFLHVSIGSLLASCAPGVIAGVAGGGVAFVAYEAVQALPLVAAGSISGVLGLSAAGLCLALLDVKIRASLLRRLGRQGPADVADSTGSDAINARSAQN